jgi:hypothetical protein
VVDAVRRRELALVLALEAVFALEAVLVLRVRVLAAVVVLRLAVVRLAVVVGFCAPGVLVAIGLVLSTQFRAGGFRPIPLRNIEHVFVTRRVAAVTGIGIKDL